MATLANAFRRAETADERRRNERETERRNVRERRAERRYKRWNDRMTAEEYIRRDVERAEYVDFGL